MLPLKLDIENFYCHSKSVIDFNDFDAAVIVGRINGNEKFSNGSGKSTIFAAIKYVLFNEVDTTSLEKVIKHSSESCRVAFEFLSSLDDQVYKIIRFRGRKAGAEVRLFRKIANGWEDLTQRTPTETDKEIVKLIKINYRTFSNSVLFAQGDVSGIAAMTPRERKTALKEALQLGVYSKYEATIKKKMVDLTKDLEKTKTIISTIGNPEDDLFALKQKTEELLPLKKQLTLSISNFDWKTHNLIEEVSSKQKEISDLTTQIQSHFTQSAALEKEILSLSSDLKKYGDKIIELQLQEEASFKAAKLLSQEVKQLKDNKLRPDGKIREDIEAALQQLSDQQSEFKQLQSTKHLLSIPLTEESMCGHCRQKIDTKARKQYQDTVILEISEIDQKLLAFSIPAIQKQLATLRLEQENHRTITALLREKEFNLEKEKKSVISSTSLLAEFKKMIAIKDQELQTKQTAATKLATDITNSSSLKDKERSLTNDLISTKKKLSLLLLERKKDHDQLSFVSNEMAVLKHRYEQRKLDQEKLISLREVNSKCEYQFVLHQKVLTAFGPSGIPALITHTILDDYQAEANNMLDRLRPGLRLQFLTENERSDGEMTDTLDITYFLNNTELEFSQLSGAQKLLVSLALRLGLAAVISKRLGIDLKMILIDEADQSLDEAALETFEQAIKELQKDYKILIITHNDSLKMKFGHAIVVDQDNNLNSVAKVSNGW